MSVYSFSAPLIDGQDQSLEQYRGQVLLIVNTASRCGFTPQYRELQQLYEAYHEHGFTILAFPCNQFMHQEPGSAAEIKDFCETNYHITFPLFDKIDVKGKEAHPLFKYLTKQAKGVLFNNIKWNFTKFLIDREGEVIKRFAPTTSPHEMIPDLERCLSQEA